MLPDSASSSGTFQVHVGGLLDVVSRHLYSQGPEVFVRELLQNGMDAITLRSKLEPGHEGRIEIELVAEPCGQGTVCIEDNGIGLTRDEALPCLATIGYSSKRDEATRSEGTIGQFGIGLLSGFMVADEIHVVSRGRSEGDKGFWWTGRVDGAWTRGETAVEPDQGTRVYLRLRPESSERFHGKELARLARRFGRFLPVTVRLRHGGASETLSGETAPWDLAGRGVGEASLLDAGKALCDTGFAGAFPFSHEESATSGVVYIEPETVSPGADPGHWLYVRRMLIGEKVRGLAPPHLPFVRLVANSGDLKVNAAREGLHGEEDRLEGVHAEVAAALDRYLERLAAEEPSRALDFVFKQRENLLRAADENGQFLSLLSKFLPLETSVGRLSLDEILRRHRRIEYVSGEKDYLKVEARARQEGVCLVRACYRDADQLIGAVERTLPAGTVQAVTAAEFLARFATAGGEETERETLLLGWVGEELRTENCVGAFNDGDDPHEAAFIAMDDVESIERLLGGTGMRDLWGAAPKVEEKRLLLNRNHRVVESWLGGVRPDPETVRLWVRVFYHLALLGGREMPNAGEQRRLSRALERLALRDRPGRSGSAVAHDASGPIPSPDAGL